MITEADIIKAIETIRDNNSATATLLQRKLWRTFAMGANTLDKLVKLWIISDQVWAKPRTIFLNPELLK